MKASKDKNQIERIRIFFARKLIGREGWCWDDGWDILLFLFSVVIKSRLIWFEVINAQQDIFMYRQNWY